MSEMYTLKLKDIISTLSTESKPYLIVLLYLFIEYMRPQTLYPVIDVLPYGKIIITMGILGYMLQKSKHKVNNSANRLMILFFLVILLSSFFGLSLDLSMFYWLDFISWMLVYYLITNIINTEKRFLLFILLFLLCSFKMAQVQYQGMVCRRTGLFDLGVWRRAGMVS